MRISLLTIILVLSVSAASFAQNAGVKKFTVPLSGTTVLSEVDDKYNTQVFNLEMPSPDANAEKIKLRSAKRRSAELFPRQRTATSNKTTAAQQPIIEISFKADSIPGGIPPDNYMAVSVQDKSVAVMNSTIVVQNGQTGQMLYRKGLKLFSAGAQLNTFNDYRYDPKVIYDPEADRYICVMLNSTDDLNYIVVGFSKTNDPAALWNF